MERYSELHPSTGKFSPVLSNKVGKLEHCVRDLLLGKASQGSFRRSSSVGLMQNDETCFCLQLENHEFEGV